MILDLKKSIAPDQTVSDAVKNILLALDDNPEREGLKDTPKRVAKAFVELTSGQKMTPSDVVGDALFASESKGMILQKNLEFYSLCEHHLLPFFGKVHIAYFPDKTILGLSKLGRIVDIFSKRLQLQEHLTHQISHALQELLNPKGIAVVIEASHFCMMMRGIKKQGSLTATYEFNGIFQDDHYLRAEFLQAIKG